MSETRLKTFFLLSAAWICLNACGVLDRLAGGGTDQPNTISGVVRGPDTITVAGAAVRLYSGHFDPSGDVNSAVPVLVKTALADSRGRFVFANPKPGDYYLEALSDDSSGIAVVAGLHKDSNLALDAGEILLDAAAGLEGVVFSGQDTVSALRLAGTHYSGAVGAGGNLVFPPLPSGHYTLYAEFADHNTLLVLRDDLVLAAGKQTQLDTMHILLDSILLFDFESADMQNRLKGIAYPADDTMSGKWFSWNVSGYPDVTIWTLDSLDAAAGRSVVLDSARTHSFTIAKSYIDISKMDSLVFYAKGPARLRTSFRTRLVPDGEGSFIAEVTVPPKWSRISVRAADIHPVPGSVSDSLGRTWAEGGRAAIIIDFRLIQGPVMRMDNLHLRGMRLQDFKMAF